MTERVRPGEAVLAQGEVQEWETPGEEEWAAPEQGQVRRENVLVLSVGQLSLTKRAFPVIAGNVPSVGKRW